MIKTIAYPVLSADGIYSPRMIDYLSRECRRLKVELILLDGVTYFAREEMANLYRVMAEIVSSSRFDAMLFCPGFLTSLITEKEIDSYIRRWQNIPIVSLCKKLDYCPSILVDNKTGIIEAVEHLVHEHNIYDIGFITGPMYNNEAVDRLEAYKDGLHKCGISYNPEMVYPGDFFFGTGITVARKLLESGRRIPRAVIASNDLLAMDFINELTRNGIDVPGDVAVIGFDDIEDASNFQIPLTTVNQPFEEILHYAVVSIVNVLNGGKTSDCILPSHLIVRNSCGCVQESVRIIQEKDNSYQIPEKSDDIINESVHGLNASSDSLSWLNNLVSQLNTSDFTATEMKQMLQIFQKNISAEPSRPLNGEMWQKALSIIRRNVLLNLTGTQKREGFLSLLEQFRLLIGHRVETDILSEQIYINRNFNISRRNLNVISTSQTDSEFYENLHAYLDMFQIKTCVILLYQEPFEIAQEKSIRLSDSLKMIFCMNDGIIKTLEPSCEKLPISGFLDIFPPEMRSNHTIHIKLINFRNLHYGFVLFDWDIDDFTHFESIKLAVSMTHYNLLSIKAMEAVEEELRQANLKLQELDRAKTNFFANISHELRTPLTLISGPVESILAGDYGENPSRDLPVFESIFRNSQRLLKLINSLLDFSRMDAGRMVLKPKKTNLSALLRFYKETVTSGASSRGLSIDFTDHTDGLIAFIDRDLFEKALFNLISNALKFTASGGSINISLHKTDDTHFTVSVSDTGIGIPEEKLRSVFERFVQVDSSTSRKYEGTGIGLAFVKEIAVLMGGDIGVKSKIGNGSCFTLALPVGTPTQTNSDEDVNESEDIKSYLLADLENVQKQNEPQAENLASDNESKACILVVDDNSDLLAFIHSVLKQEFRVITAVNGKDGLHKALEQKPDLVVSDVMMPVMDGYELATAIKKDPTLAGVPVVLLTAKADVNMKIEGLEIGADEYISKPFNSRELLARIRVLLEMKRQRDLLSQKKSLLEDLVKEQTRTIEAEKDRALGLQKKAEKQLEDFLLVLASAIETKDAYTGGHVERVAGYARELAKECGLTEQEILSIYLGAIVHDVGKIGVRDAVLNKAGKLDPEEYTHIQAHTDIGMRLLSRIKDIDTAVTIAWCHQERWDGKGYPRGLKGEAIPLAARIVTIADFWDSITTDRPYRSALPVDKALQLMREERGNAFDPVLFDLFMDERKGLYLMYHN